MTITIGGNFTAQPVLRNYPLDSRSHGQVTWDFRQNATQLTINPQGQIQVGPARVDSRLNLVSQGWKIVGVRFLPGVAF